MIRPYRTWWIAALCAASAVLILDRMFPLPAPGRDSPYAVVVVARDGTPLRAFPDKDHVWRHPVALNEVSPLYLEALTAYEDRAFWWHPGVNPFALVRAGWQWLVHGKVVSGGSTITMQVARIIDPTPRTVHGKLRQILRALQLELHHSKADILTLYVNYAPMGGVLEGVEAASRAYLGKPSNRLTHAEAALLTVLPQMPSLLRPDRFPQRAQVARDKVLRRMQGRWSAPAVADALSEPVYAQSLREPMLAPLLAQRLKRSERRQNRIGTTIDVQAQSTVEALLIDRARMLPPRVSLAAMVMDNATAEVLAYAGSADFTDRDRFSHVDMVRAARSPGSTLKPFLYAFALDEGLIHSESLLSDTPQSFSGYQPGNFQQAFNGPVSVSEALVKSLNVPAVEVLDQLGSARFVAMLRRGGLKLDFPRGAEPSLSVILGGAAARLDDMVGAYAAFARKGMAVTPRFIPSASRQEQRMMSEGAAFIVRDILETGGPLGRAVEGQGAYQGIAWKTGTSFGFRDAWAVGVSSRYSVGVWVGRPDGTPNPGFFGANVAAPLLVDIFNAFPDGRSLNPEPVPAGVSQEKICWPLGMRVAEGDAHLCPVQRTAWIFGGTTPPTFADRVRNGGPVLAYYVDRRSGLRVMPDCATAGFDRRETARWPSSLEPWLEPALRKRVLPPPWAPECAGAYRPDGGIKIVGLSDGEIIRRAPGKANPRANLEIRGSRAELMWMLNGHLIGRQRGTEVQTVEFPTAGRYDITAFDDFGQFDRISVSVMAGN
ncbi:penicillin-binding protein 1C [Noviherbaspirillum saxi]|uniref:peptidoglycan glycosyltransferase n=1 Tax=Noviherbaspirillum saxi TaxID=2320863 RepID=A0A3A3FUR3_9BURK|nr:penicillin-binding protein 1C [Noviherbaspirillum saxi]RJF99947.1 penicillin-binding protein 1C [Noviherbaspirillum saxi]